MKKTNKFIFALAAFSIFFSSTAALAQSFQIKTPPLPNNNDEAIKTFRKHQDVTSVNIEVPTVVELPITDNYMERYDFMVLDTDTDQAQPYYFKRAHESTAIPISLSSVPTTNGVYKMIDDRSNTYTDFALPEDRQGTVELIIRSSTPISSSAITVLLASNVALPNTAELRAVVGGRNTIVLSNQKMTSQTIRFPRTTSNEWHLTLKYGQPLRINELKLLQENPNVINTQSIRWLAQPGTDYRVYLDPDRYISVRTSEAGNLRSDQDVLFLPASLSKTNLLYKQSDIDNDGVPDILDNCVSITNKDQVDVNRNGRGDACDDFDKDGLMNNVDNCPNHPNRNQADIDSDGRGDACDQEESRITERLPWLPWMGIVFAVIVIAVLFTITAKSKPRQE
jgi:hypothetical protein